MATKEVEVIEPVIVPDHASVLEAFNAVAALIPVDEDSAEAVIDRMALQILTAESWADLDAPWRTDDTDDILGVEQVVEQITLRESQFAGGFGAFLVVKGRVFPDGKELVWTTSAVSVVMQLARGWAIGAFPLVVSLFRSERPSKNGYYPQHLVIHGAHGKHLR